MKHEASNGLSYYDGGQPYVGEGDVVLDFGGKATSFLQEGHKNRQFVLTVANTAAASRRIKLFAGYNRLTPSLVPGLITNGAFNDENGDPGCTGSTTNVGKVVEDFLNYLLFIPTRVKAIKVRSDQVAQIDEVITAATQTPFRQLDTENFYPNNEQDENTFQDKTATVPTPDLQLGFQKELEVSVVATSTTAFTFYMGSSYNISMALERKAIAAQENMAAIGKPALVKNASIKKLASRS